MSDEENVNEVNELDLLKNRAKQMGINFHPSIGVEKLRAKVAAKQKGIVPEETTEVDIEEDTTPRPETRMQKVARLRQDAGRLIRVRVSCMNPDKREWPGEVYTVSNSVVGTYKKYVPFNAEEGWHVPNIIFKHMLERECQIFHTVKNDRGQKVRVGKMIKELNIEQLPDLTPKEISDLAQRQAMSAGTAATM